MKRNSFTLIELLVVMAIILVLTGMVLGGISVVRKKAKIVQTTTLMKQLEVAIAAYQATYNTLPFTLSEGTSKDIFIGGTATAPTRSSMDDSGTAGAALKTATTYANLLLTLQGQAADASLNPRKQKFLELEADGVSYRDAYGNPFQVALDLTYNDSVHGGIIAGVANSGTPNTLKRGIVIWSLGADNQHALDEAGTTNKDNITSWDRKN